MKSITFTPTRNEHSTFFAVTSALNEFGFCAALNETFKIALRIAPSADENSYFNRYTSDSELHHLRIDLRVNKSIINTLCVDFLEKTDYILRVSNVSSEEEIQDFQKKLKSMKHSVFVQKLDFSKFKKKQTEQLLRLFV
ncbi:MAG: hypothetical protein LBU90_08635 [Bacteroidales bacterium]|jgi:hypothetical protein|nr:hypothetical protein [Bacteroidales bacterium]